MHGLRHAAGYVQSKLGRRLTTRFTPVLTFVLDQGVKNSLEVSRLINEALGKSTSAEGAAEQGPEE
jgi:ribosome-binding factor A